MNDIDTSIIDQEKQEKSTYLQECVDNASRIITAYWPISTFIASNSLANLENQPFADAIHYARQMRGTGTQGYLPLSRYHELFAQKRINTNDLAAAIKFSLPELKLPEAIFLAGNKIDTSWLYQSWLLNADNLESLQKKKPELWEALLKRLTRLNLYDSAARFDDFSTQTAGEQWQLNNAQTVADVVNQQLITWCAAFLDEGQAHWAMPNREQGFYHCWKALAGLDSSLHRYTRQKISLKVAALPDEASVSLAILLQQLEIPPQDWSAYLTRHLAQLPGWASVIRWRQEHPEVAQQQHYPVNLVDYLAVRLFYEALLVESEKVKPNDYNLSYKPMPLSTKNSGSSIEQSPVANIARLIWLLEAFNISLATLEAVPDDTFTALGLLANSCNQQTQQSIWQAAYEGHYRQELLSNLVVSQQKPGVAPAESTLSVQAVFCIDVRSEGFRRHLEKQGAYTTYGFAGFFGIPMLYQPLGSSCLTTVAPALLTPTQLVREVPKPGYADLAKRYQEVNNWRNNWSEIIHTLRQNLFTPFAYVEMVGWLSFFPLLGKTLLPGSWKKLQKWLSSKFIPVVPTKISIVDNPQEMSYEAQAKAVAGLLESIGLTTNFAPLVLLCGHGSATENNPYASALDCGACGGNHGGSSALVAASVLNSSPIRQLLTRQGINIPPETFFLAGEHNTTTDEISLMNEGEVPKSHQATLEQFKQALKAAGTGNALERGAYLPGATTANSNSLATIQERATDWAQVRPEWGLVKNAAFICGRRELTAHLNLDNRVFLHSYDYTQDTTGNVLEGILTAPVVVAEWINMQYYLSSVDNAAFGSSTKLLHTVVGQIGVMQGRQGDLLIGLPQQSVMVGDQLYHEPLRLCVIVEAPTSTISGIIAKHVGLQYLTSNHWITLIAYDTSVQTFHQYTTNEEWLKVDLNDVLMEAQ